MNCNRHILLSHKLHACTKIWFRIRKYADKLTENKIISGGDYFGLMKFPFVVRNHGKKTHHRILLKDGVFFFGDYDFFWWIKRGVYTASGKTDILWQAWLYVIQFWGLNRLWELGVYFLTVWWNNWWDCLNKYYLNYVRGCVVVFRRYCRSVGDVVGGLVVLRIVSRRRPGSWRRRRRQVVKGRRRKFQLVSEAVDAGEVWNNKKGV